MSAYGGSLKNLKDLKAYVGSLKNLKDLMNLAEFRTLGETSTCVWFDICGIRGWSSYEPNDGIPWAFSRLALSWCV